MKIRSRQSESSTENRARKLRLKDQSLQEKEHLLESDLTLPWKLKKNKIKRRLLRKERKTPSFRFLKFWSKLSLLKSLQLKRTRHKSRSWRKNGCLTFWREKDLNFHTTYSLCTKSQTISLQRYSLDSFWTFSEFSLLQPSWQSSQM